MVQQQQQHDTNTNTNTNKHEQKLQAVLLADSFTSSFHPITLSCPKVLCPLNNVAMLDYSIEFLAGSGVKEIFVFCVNHADQVEEYVSQGTCSQYSSASGITVHCIKDQTCTSAGDALRHLDGLNLIRSDPFILMSADIVTNVDIGAAMQAHKLRHKKDSSAIMTIVFQQSNGDASVKHSIRQVNDGLVVGYSTMEEGNRLLLYDDNIENSDVSIPSTFFIGHNGVEVRDDLVDTGISICSPDVLARFSDEFDYRDIQKQFVRNSVAEEEEGLQNRIYAHFAAEGEYAARVHDFRTYASVSRHLLKRWAFPVVPDNPPSGYEKYYRYKLGRGYIYRDTKGVTKISRSTTVGHYSMIGADCTIGEDCDIQGTIIGNNCVVHDKVSIDESFLWEDIIVEDGVKIYQSIICDGAIIRKDSIIGKGCIVGSGCIIGEGVTLPDYTRLTLNKKKDDFSDDDAFSSDDDEFSSGDDFDDGFDEEPLGKDNSNREIAPSLVGNDGKGFMWQPHFDSDSEEEEEDPLLRVKTSSIGFDATDVIERRVKLYKEDEEDNLTFGDGDDIISTGSDESFDTDEVISSGTISNEHIDHSTMMIVGRQKGVDVIKELKTLILEHEDEVSIENLAIELNSYKFSQNASFADCTIATTLAVVEKMCVTPEMSDATFIDTLKAQLKSYIPLYTKFSHEEGDEIAIVDAFENLSLTGNSATRLQKSPSFRFILQTLHDLEIVNESAILKWAAKHKTGEKGANTALFMQQPTQDFLSWLEEASDDDDDCSSDESED